MCDADYSCEDKEKWKIIRIFFSEFFICPILEFNIFLIVISLQTFKTLEDKVISIYFILFFSFLIKLTPKTKQFPTMIFNLQCNEGDNMFNNILETKFIQFNHK